MESSPGWRVRGITLILAAGVFAIACGSLQDVRDTQARDASVDNYRSSNELLNLELNADANEYIYIMEDYSDFSPAW